MIIFIWYAGQNSSLALHLQFWSRKRIHLQLWEREEDPPTVLEREEDPTWEWSLNRAQSSSSEHPKELGPRTILHLLQLLLSEVWNPITCFQRAQDPLVEIPAAHPLEAQLITTRKWVYVTVRDTALTPLKVWTFWSRTEAEWKWPLC